MFGFSVSALVVGFVAGLLVGWNVLPQPKWVQRLYRDVGDTLRDL